jgi:anti-anti-sigma factor
MLRISCECEQPAQVTVRLEGDVKGRWVEELRRECDRLVGGGGTVGRRLVLDLAGVSSMDAAGLELFRELGAESLVVKNCSPYLAELLKDVANVEP